MNSKRGFTLVEILVVIIIISIVLAMVTGGVVAALRTARSKDTESTIRTLEAACERYKTAFRGYPPTDLKSAFSKINQPNQTNLGSEALVACLSTEAGGGPFYSPPEETSAFCNTDIDRITSVPTKPYYKTTDLLEYMDSWENPIVYIHNREYATPARLVLLGGNATWSVPVLGETKTFPNRFTFVIASAGPDGVMGTEDDLKNY